MVCGLHCNGSLLLNRAQCLSRPKSTKAWNRLVVRCAEDGVVRSPASRYGRRDWFLLLKVFFLIEFSDGVCF